MTQTLKMISSMATRELLAVLANQYKRDTGRSVMAEAVGGVDAAKRINAGEVVDVVVLAAAAIDKLIASGRVLTGRVDLVKSGVAVAVRGGAPAPAIASADDVKAAVLAAPTLSFSTGPSGDYLERLFDRWGILEKIRPRLVVPPPGVPVGVLVANGTAALGFQQLSELMNLAGITVLGPLPDAIQHLTIFSGGICASSNSPAAARKLLQYLAAPQLAQIKLQHGMEAP